MLFSFNILHYSLVALGIKLVQMFHWFSLLRLSAPLESLIKEKLSAKHPEAYEWFWSEQVPAAVASFVNKLEGDGRFTAAIALYVFSYLILTVTSQFMFLDIIIIIIYLFIYRQCINDLLTEFPGLEKIWV